MLMYVRRNSHRPCTQVVIADNMPLPMARELVSERSPLDLYHEGLSMSLHVFVCVKDHREQILDLSNEEESQHSLLLTRGPT